MEDRLHWPSTPQAPARTLHGFGHHYEAYERLADGWRIRTAKLKRLAVDLSSS